MLTQVVRMTVNVRTVHDKWTSKARLQMTECGDKTVLHTHTHAHTHTRTVHAAHGREASVHILVF
jgi:hypothetical protein